MSIDKKNSQFFTIIVEAYFNECVIKVISVINPYKIYVIPIEESPKKKKILRIFQKKKLRLKKKYKLKNLMHVRLTLKNNNNKMK